MSQFPDRETATSPLHERKPLKTFINCLIAAWLFFGASSIYALILRYQYVPAPYWLDRTSVFAWSAGLATAIVLSASVWTDRSSISGGWFRSVAGLLCAPVFGLFLGWNAVTSAIPMAVALLGGYEANIQYSIIRADRDGSKHCPQPIELDMAMLVFKDLCFFSDQFRRTLSPGDTIILSGRGTSMGLFPSSARKLE